MSIRSNDVTLYKSLLTNLIKKNASLKLLIPLNKFLNAIFALKLVFRADLS